MEAVEEKMQVCLIFQRVELRPHRFFLQLPGLNR